MEKLLLKNFLSQWNDREKHISVFTSGSTGIPKEIKLSKDLMRQSALQTNSFFNISEDSLIYSCVSSKYIGGKMAVVRSLLANCPFSAEKPTNTPNLSGEITINTKENRHQTISLLSVVPSQMTFLLENLNKLPPVKSYLIGGGQIPSKIRQSIIDNNLDAWESYGMTETASHIALRKVSPTDKYFVALDDVNICLDNRNCLIIERDGFPPLITNDIAQIISDKEFIILGRYDNAINSGGKKLIPELTESVFANILDRNVCITSVPDEKWGERIILLIEGHPRNSESNDIIQRLKCSLSHDDRWKIPKNIIRIDRIPTTDNGKIDRSKAREIARQHCVHLLKNYQ